MTSVLEPLVGELSVTRQQLVSQAETIGALRADLANAQATVAMLEARTAVRGRWLWARWWPLALVVVATALAGLLAMPRRWRVLISGAAKRVGTAG
jgi:hypothetical protein